MPEPHTLLEPDVVRAASSLEEQHDLLAALLSIAISLKRIADHLNIHGASEPPP
jgi:hypothetical protein